MNAKSVLEDVIRGGETNMCKYRRCSSYAIKKYRVRHQNPDKSNNFFKQNVFNEKSNITKNPFTWQLGDPYRAQLFDISPIS